MFRQRSGYKTMFLALIAVLVMSLPLAAAAAEMTNGITNPKDGATVSGTVDVKGYANDPSFMKWQLDVLPGGDADAAIFLASGETPGEFSYTVDTTAFPNGEHALRLRVVRADSNYTEYVTKFTIANGEAKPAAVATPAAATTAVTATVQATTAVTTTAAATATPAPAAMTNGITSLKDGATVSGTVDVKGYANDPSFMKWQLDVLPGGDADAAIFLAAGDTPGEFSYTVDTTAFPNGEHALRLRVVRADSNYDEYVTKFTIANGEAKPAAVATTVEATPVATSTAATTTAVATAEPAPVAMTNGITSLKDGATVSGTVDVKGYANDPSFMKWQLDVLPGGDADAAIFLAAGDTPGEFSYTVDTTAFPNGEHALRLRVVRADSNYTEYVTKFTVANP